MQPIRKLSELADYVKRAGKQTRIAVAVGEDQNTLGALAKATLEGFVKAILCGNAVTIKAVCSEEQIDHRLFEIIDIPNELEATRKAVALVRNSEADVLMKGLVGTDKFLKAVLNKETGLLPPKAVMSYVCAVEIPRYDKLLFLSDTAVLPVPSLEQKSAMIHYAVNMAHKFGIATPKVALLAAAEKVSEHFPATTEAAMICQMAERGALGSCTIDGPLDLFLACDPESIKIKGVQTPIMGEADVLIFPSLEAANIFYKGLMLFAGGELAGLIQGTTKPVIVMSRSESALSKYYCIALSCLMAEEK